MPPLNNLRWEIFCQEYLVDLNGTQAYIRAGYTDNPDTARNNAARLLANDTVRARVEELKSERISRVEIKQDDILEELRILLKSSVEHYIAQDGTVRVKENAPADAIRAVSSVRHKTRKSKSGEEVEIEYRLWDKPKSAELLMRHMGMLNDKLKVTGDPNEPITVQNISSLSDEELAARAKSLADKVKESE